MNNITCKIRELLQKFFSDYAQPQSLYMYTCNLVAIIDHQSTPTNGDGSFWRQEKSLSSINVDKSVAGGKGQLKGGVF